MIDLEQLQTLAQLIESIEVGIANLEKAYTENNSEMFINSKKEILRLQKEVAKIVN